MSDANASAKITSENYKTVLSASGHELIADESKENGGGGGGPSPHEYLLMALGACTSITLKMYAERKKMDLQDVSVELNLTKGTDHTDIERIVTIRGNLTEQERERLLHVANACPIHKVLSNPVHIDTKLA